ncbi:type III secretion system stator protein SctL [Belnapia sp. T18]|uniref:Flagellar assembly protein FliH n=1 Tax=Belnapia arida TaxID=2804533 RepID=A0ABS1U9T6_9PROT|nr:type III secretion system stator protein SctL [Belnapia arida]MBL6080036.1 type III secretion system stator protein SctL [Belnapia arida]
MVRLVALDGGGVGLLGPGSILPAATAARLLEAEEVLAAARAEAASVVAAAHAEADALREAARLAGLAAATTEIQDRLFDIAEATASAMARTEGRIIELSLQIAGRVIGEIDPGEVTLRTARQALRLATHSRLARLRVAPGRVDALQAAVDELVGASLHGTDVDVVGDPRLKDGGCILETDAGLVDATVESQLAALARGLKRSLAASGSVGG